MNISLKYKVTVLGLCVAGASLVAPAAWGQQGTKEPAQVSGAELQAWLSKGFVIAGETHASGCVFIVLGEASQRTQFYSCPSGNTDTVKGTSRVDGNMFCSKWPYAAEEQCREWYRIGENKYELRDKGSRTRLITLFVVK